MDAVQAAMQEWQRQAAGGGARAVWLLVECGIWSEGEAAEALGVSRIELRRLTQDARTERDERRAADVSVWVRESVAYQRIEPGEARCPDCGQMDPACRRCRIRRAKRAERRKP